MNPAKKYLKTTSPVNKNKNKNQKTPKGKKPILHRSSDIRINNSKGQCCLESNKKIELLEKTINDLKSQIKLLQDKYETKRSIPDNETGETVTKISSQQIKTFVSDIRQEQKYNIPTENRFAALSKSNTKNDTDDLINAENANSALQMQKTPRGDKQSILIGDSQVRNILNNFCPDSKRKTIHFTQILM